MHRVGQFVSHVRARVEPEEESFVVSVLPRDAVDLFGGMPVADRRHGLDVARRLAEAGIEDGDLLAAALLHDAAKGHRMRLWHRVGGVVMEAVSRPALHRFASHDARSWRYPFHLYLNHAAISAEMAVTAGCSPRAGIFIRGDAAGPDARLQQALKEADDAS